MNTYAGFTVTASSIFRGAPGDILNFRLNDKPLFETRLEEYPWVTITFPEKRFVKAIHVTGGDKNKLKMVAAVVAVDGETFTDFAIKKYSFLSLS